ncbi:MAG: winged helix-turn-helix domain-containing protein, partial [Solirubrobacterales bacterium]|nr:winged helix-turn-helix domain-containing protein [Solirubrobacterales bacterium]
MEVADDDGRPLVLGAPKQRMVLAVLLLHANEVVSSDRLVEELWSGTPPSTAAKGLHVLVSRLRRAIGGHGRGCDGRLVTSPGGYLLRVAPGELDSERFELLIEEGRAALAAASPELAIERFSAALGLWRGEPWGEFAYESFAQAEIARLSELYLAALEQRIDAELTIGREAAVIGELERLVREHPFRERFRGQLMLALYRTGRQAEALQAFREARSVLVDELGIEPSAELRELHESILRQDDGLYPQSPKTAEAPMLFPRPSRGSRHTPRPMPNIAGRDRERSELRDLLLNGPRPVVTITGIAGIGKTRLALAVGADLLDQAPGGVVLVRLAGAHDPDLILPMIAEEVGIAGDVEEPLERVVARALGERRRILILDNFEQLIGGAAIVGCLAASAPQLRLLVTSQVPLRVTAEQVFALGPLAEGDASRLFIDRARARMAGFRPTDDERAAINEICTRLDGMPLAIELAAARVGSLGSRTLASRLEHPLALLTRGDRDLPERHRSLRSAIDWTYSLVNRDEQALFEQLGVCSGPVSLATVEAVAQPQQPETVLDELESLLDCSLVRRHEDRGLGIRFSMPQALRDYALERLSQVGLEHSTRRRHAEHIAAVAHAARLWKFGATPEARSVLLGLSAEIRPAVAWARDRDRDLHVRLCAGLAPYWTYTGVVPEVAQELHRAFDTALGSATERAWVTTFLAKSVQLEGTDDRALELADHAITLWEAIDDEREYAFGVGDLTWVYRWANRLNQALALTEEGLALLRRTHDPRLILRGLVFLAHVLIDLKDRERTRNVLEEAGELAGEDASWELD